MIDHIKLNFDIDKAEQWINYLPHKASGLFNVVGYSKNFKILQTRSRVYLYGSLGKYLNGNNIQAMTKSTVRKALEQLQEDTRIELNKGFVSDFEIGTCEIVKENVIEYLKLFDYFGRYTRHEYGKQRIESVEYTTSTGQYGFCIYDKQKELEDKKHLDTIPDYYKDKNLLRLELRFRNPTETFRDTFKAKSKLKSIRPFDLCDDIFYSEVVNRFYNFYQSIKKTGRNIFLDITKEYTPKELKDLFAIAFRQLHPKEYADVIGKAKLNKKNLENIKCWEKELSNSPFYSDRNDLIKELDELIKNRCIGYISQSL